MGGALIIAACNAFSQTSDKIDFLGQTTSEGKSSASIGAEAAPPPRVVISNGKESLEEPFRSARPDGDDGGRIELREPRAVKSEPTEFQNFIAESTGKLMPIYGAEFFNTSPTIFAPLSGEPVPSEYPLGPGDELLIRGWGTIDIDLKAKIDRNGMIAIPTVGSVLLSGVKAGDAQAVIDAAIRKMYKGVTIDVNFGKLRAITVYVVGHASRPGTYTVSSLSTLVTAVFASGGPNPSGSMRRIQVKRTGKVIGELDLYDFIGKGDKSADIKLNDGDTIYIPPAQGHVALFGKVNTPAIYELKTGNDTIESMLTLAGGLPVVADPRRAFLERVDQGKSQPRSVEQFALDKAGVQRTLKNGDLLRLTSISADFSNAIVLRGNVDQPVRVPYTTGMRVSDLIPSREYLLTRRSVVQQNNAIRSVENIMNVDGKGPDQDKDKDKGKERDKEKDKDNRRAGDSEARGLAAQIGRIADQINWDYALIERFDRATLSVSLIPFNLGNVFSNPGGADNVNLQPGDTITIFSQSDVAIPIEKRRVYVRVEGEVNAPGVYQMRAGDTLQSLLARAGGTTADAYLFGTAFYREQVRLEQQANLSKAADRLEAQLSGAQSRASANSRALTAVDAQVAESQRQAEMQAAKEAITRFRLLRPTGRIAFGLDPQERAFARLPQLRLADGDRLVIPSRPDFIHVFGAVNSESSPLWKARGRVSDYLKLVGTTPEADLENVFVLRVDGSVVSRSSGSLFFGGIGGVLIMPGDTIVVPEKLDKETAWTKFTRGMREWAQIFANFGLGAAAIKVLK